jgi:ubiquinone/menaquinone biosynthesis C-methylase UbiE
MEKEKKNKKDTSWGEVAEWYHDLLSKDDDSFQAQVILPNLLRLMEIRGGESVADIACGEGFFARAMQKTGAKVIGADIAEELIKIARKNSSPEIKYFTAPAHDLTQIITASIDKAVIILAIQNIDKVTETLKEVARVLKLGGKLYIVLNHPAFRIPKGSDWQFDEGVKTQFRRIATYLHEKKIPIVMHPGKVDSATTVSFHRPLQYYFKQLARAGFATLRLEEWISHRKSQSGPRAKAEDSARKEIPLFLCLETIKF